MTVNSCFTHKSRRQHLKFETAVNKSSEIITMDAVIVLSVDVSRSDGVCAPNEFKASCMNRSDSSISMSSNSMMTDTDSITSSTSSSSRESSVSAQTTSSSFTTARQCLDHKFGCRSDIRHNIELYLHSLNRVQARQERLECLEAVTGGEMEIIQQIADWEEQMLRLEATASLNSSSSLPLPLLNRRNANARLETAVSRIHAAAEIADIPTIVQEMMDPIRGGLFAKVQELGVQSLLTLALSSEENKLHVVNCSGITATVAAMLNHTGSATLQRQGAALLLNLPFFFTKKYGVDNGNEDSDFNHHHHDRSLARLCDVSLAISEKVSTTTTTTTSCLDLRCVQVLVQQGALHCIRTATEENLFQVVIDLSGDESDNYVRALAQEQIPALCQLLMDFYGYRYINNGNGVMTTTTTTTTTASSSVRPRQSPRASRHEEQYQKVGKELSFIRRGLASLVDDPSIAPDTLASCLQNKKL
jgi:hypothetical protein